MSDTTLRFEAIGTGWQIDTTLRVDEATAAAVAARIDAFDRTWSRFRDDAFIARFAEGPARAAFPPEAREDAVALFDLYRRLHDATAGAVTPFIGASLERLGYDAAYTLAQRGPALAAPRWDDVAEWDGQTLETSRPIVIDIGAAGKGRLVDLVAAVLREHGHEEFTIDASGDIRHEHGARESAPLRIALEHPYDPRKAIGVATIDAGALCASATNRRSWGEGLHHVIDGRTGEPTRAVAASWVTAPEAMTADGLATALFFTDHASLAEFFTFQSVRMFTSGLADRSVAFPRRTLHLTRSDQSADLQQHLTAESRQHMTGRLGYFFDTVLGRVTMYRLVTLSLSTLALYAFVLSLVGAVFYTPLELLATLATLLVVGYLSNRLFGALFRVHPHSESSIITSLLLFFILWPGIEPAELAWIAVAAFVASAGKYLFAIRGRHIFNPAALAALVMSVLASYLVVPGISPSVWWVANPYLLPGVILLGGLVLIRTKRLTMALLFIVVSWALVAIRLVVGGQDLGAALLTPLVSYPILFLASFMLTEPLTLPPRRWQQLGEAAVVAVLFSVPFMIGQVASTPELALLIGNVLAFVVARRRGLHLRLEGTRALTPTAVEYRFSSKRPIPFAAGQYVELTLPHRGADVRGTRRVFSIASPPEDDGTVRVAMRIPERASSFKRALGSMPVGTSLAATGVWGDFVLPKDSGKPLLLIAAGIGITPFASQLSRLHLRGERRDVVLVYVVSDPLELAYAAELQAWGTRVMVAGLAADAPLPSGWTTIGPGRVDHDRLAAALPDLAAREVFISGPPAMVDALKPALHGIGVGRVRTDAFTGY